MTRQEIENSKKFFEQPKDNSKIKGLIVSEYFPQYCMIIQRKHVPKRFGYFDLFSGPGVYEDGTLSTPILVAKNCLKKDILQERVWLVFNDYYYSDNLRGNFDRYIGLDTFKLKPHFGHSEVGNCESIDAFLQKTRKQNGYNECPSVLFFDPFGYKTINTILLCRFMQDWGNEMFLFFNTKRITPALSNEKFEKDMRKLFPLTYEDTRKQWNELPQKYDRLLFLVESLKLEFEKQMGKMLFCTPFQFMEDDTGGTSHFLLHFTKDKRGYDLIKQIMDQHGRLVQLDTGVLSYMFDGKQLENELANLFNKAEYERIIADLAADLFEYIKQNADGLSALDIFDNHQITTRYSRNHYTQAMRKLAADKKITAAFSDDKKHSVSVILSESCIIKVNSHANE